MFLETNYREACRKLIGFKNNQTFLQIRTIYHERVTDYKTHRQERLVVEGKMGNDHFKIPKEKKNQYGDL